MNWRLMTTYADAGEQTEERSNTCTRFLAPHPWRTVLVASLLRPSDLAEGVTVLTLPMSGLAGIDVEARTQVGSEWKISFVRNCSTALESPTKILSR